MKSRNMARRKTAKKLNSYLSKKNIAIAIMALFVVLATPVAYNSLKKSTTKAIEGASDVQVTQSSTVANENAVAVSPTESAIVTNAPTSTPSESNKTEIEITLKGQVYNDANCNNVKETGENGLSDKNIAILNLKSEYDVESLDVIKSDSNGNYSFTKKINDGDSINVQAVPGVNLVFAPKVVTFNNDNRSFTVDLSACPEK